MNTARKNEISTDYAALVVLLRQGKVVECVIDAGVYKGIAAASYDKKWYGDLFSLTMKKELDFLPFSSENEFVVFCTKNGVVFDAPIAVIEVAA